MDVPADAPVGAVLVIDRSACAMTVLLTVALLLRVFGSVVVVLTVAVLLIVDPAGADGETATTRLNVANGPGASVAMLQVTVAPVEQVNVGPPVCASETKVVFGGSASVQETFAAFDGPLLTT